MSISSFSKNIGTGSSAQDFVETERSTYGHVWKLQIYVTVTRHQYLLLNRISNYWTAFIRMYSLAGIRLNGTYSISVHYSFVFSALSWSADQKGTQPAIKSKHWYDGGLVGSVSNLPVTLPMLPLPVIYR